MKPGASDDLSSGLVKIISPLALDSTRPESSHGKHPCQYPELSSGLEEIIFPRVSAFDSIRPEAWEASVCISGRSQLSQGQDLVMGRKLHTKLHSISAFVYASLFVPVTGPIDLDNPRLQTFPLLHAFVRLVMRNACK